MEELKAQVRRLLGQEEVKPSPFAKYLEALQDPFALAFIGGIIVLFLVAYRGYNQARVCDRVGR